MNNNQLNSPEEIMTYTHQKLEVHFQNDEDFNREFITMFHFYFNKLKNIIPEKDLEELEKHLFNVTKAQFFNGYFMIQEFLHHEEIGNVEDVWLEQHHGFITEQIPEIIKSITGENFEDTVITQEMQELTMDLVTRYEDIRSYLKQMAFDIAYLGSKQAFIDEREKRNIKEAATLETGMLAEIGTLDFVTPQHYLTLQHIAADGENWLLEYWSSIENKEDRAGEVTIMLIPGEEKVEYAVKIYLNNSILEHERQMIVEVLIAMVMGRNNTDRNSINVSIAVVEDFYLMVQQ